MGLEEGDGGDEEEEEEEAEEVAEATSSEECVAVVKDGSTTTAPSRVPREASKLLENLRFDGEFIMEESLLGRGERRGECREREEVDAVGRGEAGLLLLPLLLLLR